MQIQDLMINDWVEWMGNYCNVDLPLLMTEYQDNVDSKFVKPIPLTSEILKKNGFRLHARYNGYGYAEENIWMDYNHNIEVVITIYASTIRVFTDDGIDHEGTNLLFLQDIGRTRYIHELQHVLRLCGLDGLANNFKI